MSKHQKIIQIKDMRQNDKNNGKYALMKRFHHDRHIQFYMYDLM